jgi:hypothetical protein
MRLYKIVSVILFCTAFLSLSALDEPATQTSEPAVYVVVFRTPAHVRNSKPEVFHGFAQDLWSFLKEKDVPLKVDPERGTIESESPMSVESMLNIAKQVGASTLLFVTVDRPMTKWIKVTVKSYGLDGQLQWSEEASDAGSLTGKGGYKKTLERIETGLSKRLGGPGLPVKVQEIGTPQTTQEAVKP